MARRFHAGCPDLRVMSPADEIADLPMVGPVDDDQQPAPSDARRGLSGFRRVGRQVGQAKPQQLQRRRGGDRLEPGQVPQTGESAVRANGEQAADFVPAVGPAVANAADHTVLLDQPLHVGSHHQPKVGVFPGLPGQEFQEALLRHDQDVREARLQAAKIDRLEGPDRRRDGRAVEL